MKRNSIKVLVDLLLYLLIAFIFSIIILRGLPYSIIKSWPYVFLKLEGFLYAAAVLFMMRQIMETQSGSKELFFSPLSTGNEQKIYVKQDIIICSLLFLFSFFYLLVNFNKHLPNLDEAFVLNMSKRVLNGQIPHKDFFLLMNPGAVYLNACVFKFFGLTILTERIATLVLASLASALVYLIARVGMSFFFSIGVSLFFLAWGFPTWFQASYSWYAVVFSIASLWITSLTIRKKKAPRTFLFLIGILCGMAFMLKQNTGLLTLFSIISYFSITNAIDKYSNKKTRLGFKKPAVLKQFFIELLQQSAILFVAFSIPFVVVCYLYAREAFLADYLCRIFILPFQLSSKFTLPYMEFDRITDKRIIAYMPYLATAYPIVILLNSAKRRLLSQYYEFPLLLILAAVGAWLAVFPRADFVHITFALWPSVILIGYWIQHEVVFLKDHEPFILKILSCSPDYKIRIRSVIVVLVPCLFFTSFLIHRTEKNLRLRNDLREIENPIGKGIYGKANDADELNEVLRFLQVNRPQREIKTIFSMNPLLYFLTDFDNLTAYDYIIAGNGPEGYAMEILRVLEDSNIDIVLVDMALDDYPEPTGWPKVKEYMRTNYRAIFTSSGCRYILLRKASPDTGQKCVAVERTSLEVTL